MRILLMLIMLLLYVNVASAQNDPGHDTLYIEQQGDSELNGSFNVTQNATVRGGELEINNQFEIRGNGNIPSSNTNFIVGDHDDFISINSKGTGGVLRLQDQVANGLVLIGATPSFLNDLNVSNDMYVLGNYFSLDTNFELRSDGTFPSTDINHIVVNQTGANRRMWITSQEIILGRGITNGMVYVGETTSDSVALNVTGDIIGQGNLTIAGNTGTILGSQICTVANGLCGGGGGGSNSGGWSNTSTTTSTDLNVNITGNLNIYNETGSTLLYFNNTNGNLNLTNNLTVTGGGIYDSGSTARVVFQTNKVIINLG